MVRQGTRVPKNEYLRKGEGFMKSVLRVSAMVMASCIMITACSGDGASNDKTSATEAVTTAAMESAKKETKTTESNKSVSLTLWADYVTPERTKYVENMVKNYMEENPNVVIEVTPLPDGADDKVITAYEAGQGPDIFLSSGPDITSHINGEYVIPLDEYFDKWEKKDMILPSAIETVRQYDVTGSNQLYYIPNGISFTVLWVRSDWLKETNSTVDTWDNLFKAVENMTDKDSGRYGIALRGGKGGAKFLERQMYAYSGLLSVFDENGKCTINDPKNVEFVERYLGLYGKCTAEGDLNYGWTELAAAFDSGVAGMIIHNLGSASNHMDAFEGDTSKFEAVGMPLNEKGTSVNLMTQPGGMTISSTCKNPDVAFDFISYMTTGEPVSEYCQQWGVVPVDKEVLESASWIKEQPWYEMSAEKLLDEKTLFYNQYSWLPGHDDIYTDMDTNSQYVMTGEMTAQEMLDEWAAYYQDCYDKYYNK